jgi:hypothetical protein
VFLRFVWFVIIPNDVISEFLRITAENGNIVKQISHYNGNLIESITGRNLS